MKTVFIATGFPENRTKMLRKCGNDEKGFEVDDIDGKFVLTESIHDKYSLRPLVIAPICLVQFVMWYDFIGQKESGKFIKKNPHIQTSGYLNLSKIKTEEKIIVCQDSIDCPPAKNSELLMPEYILLINNKVMRRRSYAAVIRRHKFKQELNPHEFFYSELLLFRPWFNETELFEKSVEMCQKLYNECDINNKVETEKLVTKVDLVQRGLFPHKLDVQEGREMVEKFEFDKNEETAIELDPDGHQKFDDDAEISWKEAIEYTGLHPDEMNDDIEMRKSLIPDKWHQLIDVMDTEELLNATRELVNEQRIALNIVLGYCKNLKKSLVYQYYDIPQPPLLAVHGGAGTGKSTLIRVMSQWIERTLQMPGEEFNCPYVMRAAPTGMAASNIGGVTLHSAFNLNFGHNYIPLSDKKRDILRHRFKNVRILIIDEFSMVKSNQLYQIHQRLCEIKQSTRPFGSISVILFGDLMQLKPIKGSYIFEEPKQGKYKEIYNIFPLWNMFETIDLEENHRQGEDKSYADLLNRLRFKSKDEQLSSEDLDMLKSRVLSCNNTEEIMKIYGKNITVNLENTRRLNNLKTMLYKIEAIHTPHNRNVKINLDGTIEDTAFLNQINIKEGARVMIIDNINTPDGLTNGAQGTLEKILEENGKVRYMMIKFENKNIGREQRIKFKFLNSKCNLDELVPIERVNFSYPLGNVEKNHAARASLLQFPVKLSWALTAHRVSNNFEPSFYLTF